MSWKDVLRKSQATATRSAELWSMNDYDVYQDVNKFIKEKARKGLDKDEIFNAVVKYLPERMTHLKGFMEELIEYEPSDGISDVDWVEVAEGYEPEIKEQIEFFAE